MLYLASEIEDIIALTGNISLPQIVVTIANVALLLVNVVLAIIKKVKKIKNEKQVVDAQALCAIDDDIIKEKTVNTNQKIKATILKEKFESEYDVISTGEAESIATALMNALADIPSSADGYAELSALLYATYVEKVCSAYESTKNIRVLAALKNIFEAFGYQLTILVKKTEEVITHVDVEEPLL